MEERKELFGIWCPDTINLISLERLEVPSDLQRPLSPALVKSLEKSILQLGFIVPLIVSSRDDTDNTFLILDGQHRFKAGENLGMNLFPCIILPGEKWKEAVMLMNTEKADNIKDLCEKVFGILMTEQDTPISSLLNGLCEPYLPVLSVAYLEKGLKSPAFLTDIIKHCYHSLPEVPFSDIREELYEEADLWKGLEDTANSVAKTFGISDYVLKKAMLNRAFRLEFEEKEEGKKRGYINVIGIEIPEVVSKTISRLLSTDWSYLAKGRT